VSQAPDDDREFEAFLARETPLQQRWHDASHEEPTPQVDAAVRAAARRAVGARPGAIGRSRFTHWRVPLAVAATLVLGTTITLMVAEQDAHVPSVDTAPGVPTSAGNPAASGAAAPAEERRPALQAPAARSQLPAEPAPSRLRTPPPTTDFAGAPLPQREVQDVPVPAVPREEDLGKQADAPESESPSSQPSSARSVPAPQTAEPAREDRAQQESLLARPGALYAKKPAIAAEEEPDAEIDAWLERIRALRRAGKTDEAEQSLLAFRQRHPEVALPEDLRNDR